MNNNFKTKKTSLKKDINFNNELDKIFEIKKVKPLNDELQNAIDALTKNTTIAELIGVEETYYIVISKDYNNMVGTKSDIEKMISEYKPNQKDLVIYELKSPKPVSFSFETKISLKINK
jgi:hypothetical protein